MSKVSVASEPCKEAAAKLLIVEGKDDCHGIYHLAAQRGLEREFGIWSGDNDGKALRQFTAKLITTEDRPSSLGIVLDSDGSSGSSSTGLAHRWNQLKGRLEEVGYTVPDTPPETGLVLGGFEELPRVGVWLMPDNQSDGMFEDFLVELAPEASADFARRVVQIAKKHSLGNFKDIHRAKAVVHTYLAWQDEPGRPIGIAMKSKLFNADAERASTFLRWLRDLFQVL